jgi:hypothetical protein
MSGRPAGALQPMECRMEFFIFWLCLGVVTALAAQARGRSFVAWLLIGCVTGIFGLIAVLVMNRATPEA